jgi:hypothetical protein
MFVSLSRCHCEERSDEATSWWVRVVHELAASLRT